MMKLKTFLGVAAALFAGMAAATSAQASTVFSQISLAPVANNFAFFEPDFFPGDTIHVGGAPFKTTNSIAGDTSLFDDVTLGFNNVETVTIPINITSKVSSFFTLISSQDGFAGDTDGTLTFVDSLGNRQSFDLTEGDNIRNFETVADGNQDIKNIAGTKTLSNDEFRLDAQRFDLSGLADLKEIQFTLNTDHNAALFLFGATAVIATPLPAALPMFGAAVAGLGAFSRRRRARQELA